MMSDPVEKTRKYYEHLSQEDLCDCKECRNYRKKIKQAFPELSVYLSSLGVDIEKPFESWSVELEDHKILYPDVQYIVFGDEKDFKPCKISGSDIHIAQSHPMTLIDESHYVIEVSEICLDDRDA